MEKEFVPYDLAVKLKKLGFDEPCFFAFDNCSTPMRCSDLRTNEQKFNGVNYNSSTYTSQPTFSQAFRWFREKYELHSFIYSDYTWNISGGIWDLNGYKDSRYDWDSEIHTTYEEAEIDLLTNLIEIVKQHKN